LWPSRRPGGVSRARGTARSVLLLTSTSSPPIAHGVAAGQLARHLDDPFDRMLIAQALAEGLTIVTRDKRFDDYKVSLLPA
jgi:PIN domain nuclease of toxin-antitoxin system